MLILCDWTVYLRVCKINFKPLKREFLGGACVITRGITIFAASQLHFLGIQNFELANRSQWYVCITALHSEVVLLFTPTKVYNDSWGTCSANFSHFAAIFLKHGEFWPLLKPEWWHMVVSGNSNYHWSGLILSLLQQNFLPEHRVNSLLCSLAFLRNFYFLLWNLIIVTILIYFLLTLPKDIYSRI